MPLSLEIYVIVNMMSSTVRFIVSGVELPDVKVTPTCVLEYRQVRVPDMIVQLKVALSPRHTSPGLLSSAAAKSIGDVVVQ